MASRTVTIYEVPESYLSAGGTVPVQGVHSLALAAGAGPGDAAQQAWVAGCSAGTVSDWRFLYSDAIRWRSALAATWRNDVVRTLRMTVDRVTRVFLMADAGPTVPGLSAGNLVNLRSFRSYAPLSHPNIPCFVAGTRIATPSGETAVECLSEGDLVMTRDGGPRRIRWTGSVTLGARDLMAAPHLRPVRIAPGALGPSTPRREVLLSPRHRVLLTGWDVEHCFGEPEVLVAAGHLVGRPGISVAQRREGVTYHHVLLDQHEILYASGLPTESFLVGDAVREALPPEQMAEIRAILPELGRNAALPARRIVGAAEVATLLAQAA